MSAPDARLSAAEQAALADLEAAAAAADPQLAARLKAAPGTRVRTLVPSLRPQVLHLWAAFLSIGWGAVPLTLIGLGLAVLGLSAGLAVSACGALLAAAGLRALAEMVERRWVGPPRSRRTA